MTPLPAKKRVRAPQKPPVAIAVVAIPPDAPPDPKAVRAVLAWLAARAKG